MAQFTIQLKDSKPITVSEADTYQFEGPLTTFFSTGSSLQVIDSWSTRVASYRTADIVSIERCDDATANQVPIIAEPAPTEIDLRGLVAA